jgi:hypothetical protein
MKSASQSRMLCTTLAKCTKLGRRIRTVTWLVFLREKSGGVAADLGCIRGFLRKECAGSGRCLHLDCLCDHGQLHGVTVGLVDVQPPASSVADGAPCGLQTTGRCGCCLVLGPLPS